MARNIPSLHLHKLYLLPSSITFFITILFVFAIFSMVSFLCGVGSNYKRKNEKKKSVQLGGEKPLLSSTKALIMTKLICWRKDEDEDEDDENALWKRTIIKGGKCKPLEF
ncbi:hypothetical protein AABB24_005071 [Solanum stoloniferum]|uniref:Transmembrane protein n=1 Tax=Solanum stoloniferum TaxID=62892 RepID=A0ABD2UVL6_9SOLN